MLGNSVILIFICINEKILLKLLPLIIIFRGWNVDTWVLQDSSSLPFLSLALPLSISFFLVSQKSPLFQDDLTCLNFRVFIFFLDLREKLVRVSSQDYGRDLQGVQNLLKKHRRLEGELVAHEPAIQVGQEHYT